MTVKQHQVLYNVLYFVTITCIDWIPIIERINAYEKVKDQFMLLQKEACSICGYVIMPNHFHFLVYLPQDKNLHKLVSNLKRFLTYSFIKELTVLKEHEMLLRLSQRVSASASLKGSKHKVFFDSFDAKPCWGAEFIQQKLDYMHANPISGKWMLARFPEEYVFSSAKFYAGLEDDPNLTDYRLLLEYGLINPIQE
jgi:putative transposase